MLELKRKARDDKQKQCPHDERTGIEHVPISVRILVINAR
jgi:hypothetical protein